ncbi:MAG: hypothetical protein BZ138_08445, partial [Methanosphaera sp. rholeuAM270]
LDESAESPVPYLDARRVAAPEKKRDIITGAAYFVAGLAIALSAASASMVGLFLGVCACTALLVAGGVRSCLSWSVEGNIMLAGISAVLREDLHGTEPEEREARVLRSARSYQVTQNIIAKAGLVLAAGAVVAVTIWIASGSAYVMGGSVPEVGFWG